MNITSRHRRCITSSCSSLFFLLTSTSNSLPTSAFSKVKYYPSPNRNLFLSNYYSSSSSSSFTMTNINTNTNTNNDCIVKELTLTCSDGIKLAVKQWTHVNDHTENSNDTLIVCLHGWLDNASSFDSLAPSLTFANTSTSPHNHDAKVVALDLPGHGKSSHKSPDAPPQLISEYTFYIYEAIQQLNQGKNKKVILVGHSMGAAIALLFTSAFPELVQSVILLDGAGPLSKQVSSLPNSIQSSVLNRTKKNLQKKKRIYKSLEDAIAVRMKSATLLPGKQYMRYQTAKALVQRSTTSVEDIDDGGLMFHHDVRLNWPSLQYLTPEQVDVIYESIASSSCTVCLLRAQDGWPISESLQMAIQTKLKPSYFQTLPGSHYFHSDPDTAPAVLSEIKKFLLKQNLGK